jgi:hypothetical protein
MGNFGWATSNPSKKTGRRKSTAKSPWAKSVNPYPIPKTVQKLELCGYNPSIFFEKRTLW